MKARPLRRGTLFNELRRRHVFRVVAMYGVAAWVVIQVTATTFPLLNIADRWASLVLMLCLAGFPVTVLLAWVFDLTPQGVQRTDDLEHRPIALPPVLPSWRAASLLAAALLLTTAGVAWWAGSTSGAVSGPVAAVSLPKSIAVLPFENLSSDAENAYFAGGMHDELLTQLSRVAELKVISRGSVLGYANTAKTPREIAEELEVATLLEGSVQREGSRVRVTVRLVDAGTGGYLWSESYDRDLTDVLAIQSEVAEEIVAALQVNLTASERERLARAPTADAEAYTFYLQAQEYYRRPDAQRGNLENAVRLYEEAVRLDPGFALAFAKLADAHGALYWFGYDPTPERLQMQLASVQEALRLAPDLPEAHQAMGTYHYRARNYEAALASFEVARVGLPSDAYLAARTAYVYRRQGRWAEAVEQLETAVDLNPRDADLHRDLAQTYHAGARFSDADQAYRRALALTPDYFRSAIRRGHVILDWRGTTDTLRASLAALPTVRHAEATVGFARWYLAMVERDFDEAARIIAAHPEALFSSQEYFLPRSFLLGQAYARAGDPRARAAFDSARVTLEAAVREVPTDNRRHLALGRVYAELGMNEQAVASGRLGMDLLGVDEDAFQGPVLALDLAEIYGRVGQADEAIALLESLPETGFVSGRRLRLDPRWDPLRADPRFERLVRER